MVYYQVKFESWTWFIFNINGFLEFNLLTHVFSLWSLCIMSLDQWFQPPEVESGSCKSCTLLERVCKTWTSSKTVIRKTNICWLFVNVVWRESKVWNVRRKLKIIETVLLIWKQKIENTHTQKVYMFSFFFFNKPEY